MATFGQQLAAFEQKAIERAETVVKQVASALVTRIVERTPVLTGRLKANNQVGINERPGYSNNFVDPAGQRTLAVAFLAIGQYKLGDNIYVVNNLVYAWPIEFTGHSHTKAPAGFFRVSVADVINNFPGIVQAALNVS